MFIIGHLLAAMATIINAVLFLLMIVFVIRAILSWVSPDPYNPIVNFIHNVTEPILQPIRQKLPVVYGGLDFSVLIVLLAITFLRSFLMGILTELATKF